jgi:magnesium-transporting ATPase (P-type)
MSEKNISMETYQWSHFAAIMVDVIVFLIIAYLSYRIRNVVFLNDKNSVNTLAVKKIRTAAFWIFWISIIIAIVTLFGLWPVFTDYDKIIIE